MSKQQRHKLMVTALAWATAAIIFFPLFWMFLTGFKTEVEAIATPPSLFFTPVLDGYEDALQRADYFRHAWNSIQISGAATILALLLAVPAAYAMATKMLPPVGVLVPIYLLFRDLGLLDQQIGLIIVYALINLPIVVWMLYTFFKEVPHEILEAGRMDGARPKEELYFLLVPLSLPGIASTALLSSPQGLFWAQLSAASTMAIAPILVFGWMSQKQLVRGLTFGAVK